MTYQYLQKLNLFLLLMLIVNINLHAQTEINLSLQSPNGGEYWTIGSFPRIVWRSSNILVIKIEISFNAGDSWESISAAAIAAYGAYSTWQIGPNIESDKCLIRISKYDDPTVYDISDSFFSIVSDTSSHTLVVLGSSTAAGVGASSIDSGWVKRYRNYLFEKNTTFKVISLAVGGYTTYDIMPTGYFPPANRPTPKIGNNISKAVTYNPEAIIINLPSNDVNMGYSIAEQLSNYDTIITVASDNNIPVWVTTTQPRNFSVAQIQKQIEMRDSTFSRFGEKAIDFWTDIADSSGRINPEYNSGDGIHLNDKGHANLFRRAVAAEIFNPMVVLVEEKFVFSEYELLQNYPNPFNPLTTIKYKLPKENFVTLVVFDILGNQIAELVRSYQPAGSYDILFSSNNLKIASGTYFYQLRTGDFVTVKKMLLLK
jgi:lysophospholipase L1-like esterase